jgi:hypothetical protein
MEENHKENVKIVSNDAIKGKPNLDIDRVITEVKSGHTHKER